MKYINKCIAIGLGFALIFTGTNFVHGMFTSTAIQENIITMKMPSIVIKDLNQSYFVGKTTGGGKYTQLYIPVVIEGISSDKLDIQAKVVKINPNGTEIFQNQIKIGKGVHTNGHSCNKHPNLNDSNTDCVIIDLGNKEFGVHENYNITITVKIKGGMEPTIFNKTYGIEKYNQSNDCDSTDNGRIQHSPLIDPYPINSQEELVEPEIIEPPKEEIEKPSEPEIVEPSKEEIEVPSEPEIVEPPKEEVEIPSEPEVVEPPKEEIIEIPKQPEAIEPPKENEGIQE